MCGMLIHRDGRPHLLGWGREFGGAGVCFIHAERDNRSGGGGDGGDHGDRDAKPGQVGDDAGKQRAHSESAVAPETVDADRAAAPGRVGDIADHGQ